MEECEQFTGYLRDICEGRADMPLEKINAYRAKWGLNPLFRKSDNPALSIRSFTKSASLSVDGIISSRTAARKGTHRIKPQAKDPLAQVGKLISSSLGVTTVRRRCCGG